MRLLYSMIALCLFLSPAIAQDTNPVDMPPPEASPIDIPYEKFTLDNGLTVIVHEDRKAPIVAVNFVVPCLDPKNEKSGQKPALLICLSISCLMGLKNFDDDYFQVLERVGATDLNGTTNPDRTNYFQKRAGQRAGYGSMDGV